MSEEVAGADADQDPNAAGAQGQEGTADAQARSSGKNLEVVLDIPVRLSMEVGGTKITIRKLLQLSKGSIVELPRTAGEPLDVLVNGTLVATGEVVMVNEKLGVRLLDVISPEQRIQSINQ